MNFMIPYSRKYILLLIVFIGITTLILFLIRPHGNTKINFRRVPIYKLLTIILTNVIIGTQGYKLYKMCLLDMQMAGIKYSRNIDSPNMVVFCVTLYLFICNLINCYMLISGVYDDDIKLLPIFVMLLQIIAYLILLSAMLLNGFTVVK